MPSPLTAFDLIIIHENGYQERIEFVAPTLPQAVAALEKRNPGCQIAYEKEEDDNAVPES